MNGVLHELKVDENGKPLPRTADLYTFDPISGEPHLTDTVEVRNLFLSLPRNTTIVTLCEADGGWYVTAVDCE